MNSWIDSTMKFMTKDKTTTLENTDAYTNVHALCTNEYIYIYIYVYTSHTANIK